MPENTPEAQEQEKQAMPNRETAAPADPASEIESPQDRLIDTVTAAEQEVIETFESAGQAMVEGIGLAQQEIADFITERIRQDLDTQQAYLRCRSLDELREINVRFLRTALDQYGDEASRLFRIGSDVAARSFERLRA
jgi:hypothetical protein